MASESERSRSALTSMRYFPIQLVGEGELARSRSAALDLQDVKGQAQAHRALEIAAAGGHNQALSWVKPLKLLL